MTDAPTLLVVDDNDNNRYTLMRRLVRLGYAEVEAAENGIQALDMLARQPFDLVLLDIVMPGMNGYDVLKKLKASPDLRHIPVIMISAIDEYKSVIKCIELGAEDYLPKPFDPVLLNARVGASLEKKRLRDQEAAYLERLEAEKKRADDLLAAILPPSAVQELKLTNGIKPRRHEDVAVLFCDIVGFTSYCDRNAPELVVSELQELVVQFENIVHGHGMEKIKTIGDAFMATAGLLSEIEEPMVASVNCGLDMIAAAKRYTPQWRVRVGIHTGPVITGIMGQRQYLFDLWGDTVNVAARVVEHADSGIVTLSTAAWAHVHHAFEGESRGLFEVKGKGVVELIQCHGPKAQA